MATLQGSIVNIDAHKIPPLQSSISDLQKIVNAFILKHDVKSQNWTGRNAGLPNANFTDRTKWPFEDKLYPYVKSAKDSEWWPRHTYPQTEGGVSVPAGMAAALALHQYMIPEGQNPNPPNPGIPAEQLPPPETLGPQGGIDVDPTEQPQPEPPAPGEPMEETTETGVEPYVYPTTPAVDKEELKRKEIEMQLPPSKRMTTGLTILPLQSGLSTREPPITMYDTKTDFNQVLTESANQVQDEISSLKKDFYLEQINNKMIIDSQKMSMLQNYDRLYDNKSNWFETVFGKVWSPKSDAASFNKVQVEQAKNKVESMLTNITNENTREQLQTFRERYLCDLNDTTTEIEKFRVMNKYALALEQIETSPDKKVSIDNFNDMFMKKERDSVNSDKVCFADNVGTISQLFSTMNFMCSANNSSLELPLSLALSTSPEQLTFDKELEGVKTIKDAVDAIEQVQTYLENINNGTLLTMSVEERTQRNFIINNNNDIIKRVYGLSNLSVCDEWKNMIVKFGGSYNILAEARYYNTLSDEEKINYKPLSSNNEVDYKQIYDNCGAKLSDICKYVNCGPNKIKGFNSGNYEYNSVVNVARAMGTTAVNVVKAIPPVASALREWGGPVLSYAYSTGKNVAEYAPVAASVAAQYAKYTYKELERIIDSQIFTYGIPLDDEGFCYLENNTRPEYGKNFLYWHSPVVPNTELISNLNQLPSDPNLAQNSMWDQLQILKSFVDTNFIDVREQFISNIDKEMPTNVYTLDDVENSVKEKYLTSEFYDSAYQAKIKQRELKKDIEKNLLNNPAPYALETYIDPSKADSYDKKYPEYRELNEDLYRMVKEYEYIVNKAGANIRTFDNFKNGVIPSDDPDRKTAFVSTIVQNSLTVDGYDPEQYNAWQDRHGRTKEQNSVRTVYGAPQMKDTGSCTVGMFMLQTPTDPVEDAAQSAQSQNPSTENLFTYMNRLSNRIPSNEIFSEIPQLLNRIEGEENFYDFISNHYQELEARKYMPPFSEAAKDPDGKLIPMALLTNLENFFLGKTSFTYMDASANSQFSPFREIQEFIMQNPNFDRTAAFRIYALDVPTVKHIRIYLSSFGTDGSNEVVNYEPVPSWFQSFFSNAYKLLNTVQTIGTFLGGSTAYSTWMGFRKMIGRGRSDVENKTKNLYHYKRSLELLKHDKKEKRACGVCKGNGNLKRFVDDKNDRLCSTCIAHNELSAEGRNSHFEKYETDSEDEEDSHYNYPKDYSEPEFLKTMHDNHLVISKWNSRWMDRLLDALIHHEHNYHTESKIFKDNLILLISKFLENKKDLKHVDTHLMLHDFSSKGNLKQVIEDEPGILANYHV
jgi:hypothetical protein